MRKKTPVINLSASVKTADGHVYLRKRSAAVLHMIAGMILSSSYELTVTYYPGVTNKGTYSTKKELIEAFRAFSDIRELRFIKKYWNNGNEPRPKDIY